VSNCNFASVSLLQALGSNGSNNKIINNKFTTNFADGINIASGSTNNTIQLNNLCGVTGDPQLNIIDAGGQNSASAKNICDFCVDASLGTEVCIGGACLSKCA